MLHKGRSKTLSFSLISELCGILGKTRPEERTGPSTELDSDRRKSLHQWASRAQLVLIPHTISASEAEAFLRNPPLPLVIWDEACCGEEAWLLSSRRGKKLSGMIFTESGREEKEWSDAATLSREWGRMTTGDSLHFFVPIAVDPLVSASDSSPKTPVGRFLNLLRLERRDIALIYVYAAAIGLLSLTLPLGVQAITNYISGGMIMEPAWVLIILVVMGIVASGGLTIMQSMVVEFIQQRLFARAAFEFAFRIPKVKMESLLHVYAPELMNRFFDILTIQKGFSKILNEFVTAILSILFGLILLSFYHPVFVAFSFFLLFFLFIIFYVSGPRGLKTSLDESKYKFKVAHWLEEIARNLASFKLAGYSDLHARTMDGHVGDFLNVRKAHFRVLLSQMISILVFKAVISGGLLIIGSLLVVNRQITLGQFIASEIVIITVLNGVEKVFVNIDKVYDLLAAVEKIGNVTDLPLERQDGIPLPPSPKGMEVRAENLSYRFPDGDRDVISGLNFKLEAGEKVAIAGFNGSGRTTLIKVLTGMYEGYSGGLSYDGISQHDLNISLLREKIGTNFGFESIFDGTMWENITMGHEDIPVARVMKAAELAGLDGFIRKSGLGLNTPLIAGGKSLNSDMVKKIILARSIVTDPRLLVFDDYFYSSDFVRRKHLQAFVMDRSKPWTVIALTNDPGFLAQADRILVMKEGRIIFSGNFQSFAAQPEFRSLTGMDATA